ncbi:hypothetical protein ABGN05_27135 [Aquibium sp. LZ166]|uniref:Uncharacterized protein n=1 Tax=Aquibium pacificus TaxID=3153579 RepID=A0ABV3SRA1_9HYPH
MSLSRPRYRFCLPRSGRIVASGALLAGSILLPGCASVSIEEAVPAAALASNDPATAQPAALLPAPATPSSLADATSVEPAAGDPVAAEAVTEQPPPAATGSGLVGVGPSAPASTGQYPNLNIPRRSAAEQLARSETREAERDLKSAARGQGKDLERTTVEKKDMDDLRKLGATHGAKALKEIEGE